MTTPFLYFVANELLTQPETADGNLDCFLFITQSTHHPISCSTMLIQFETDLESNVLYIPWLKTRAI